MIYDLTYIVEQARQDNPTAWATAHNGTAQSEDFIRYVTPLLSAEDVRLRVAAGIANAAPRIGLNGKRGNPNDLSDDAVNVLGEGPGRTPGGVPCQVIDIIGAAGSPQAVPTWQAFTNPQDASGAWVDPGGSTPVPPQPGPIPPFPPRDQVVDAGITFNEHYRLKGAGQNGTLGGSAAYSQTARFFDFEGECVWLPEYLRRRQLGEAHMEAITHVLADIDAAWG